MREAFLKTIPRQPILEAIVTPVDPEAEVLDSQPVRRRPAATRRPSQTNGSDDYAEPDIEGAKELLAGATPTVSILYNTNNPNRVDAFQLIQASATEAGFVIVDAGSPDWSSLLGSGTYDASSSDGSRPVSATRPAADLADRRRWQLQRVHQPRGGRPADESQVTIGDEERPHRRSTGSPFEDVYGLPLFQGPGLWRPTAPSTASCTTAARPAPIWNTWEWTPVS